MSIENNIVNKFKENLNNQLTIIKNCQEKNSIKNCMQCEQILKCTTRTTYVKAVYASMNKGKTGGFEF